MVAVTAVARVIGVAVVLFVIGTYSVTVAGLNI